MISYFELSYYFEQLELDSYRFRQQYKQTLGPQ